MRDGRDAWRKCQMSDAKCALEGIAGQGVNIMTRSQLNSSVGVLLLDSQFRLVHHTVEAATILDYPTRTGERVSLDKVLPAIRSQLEGRANGGAAPREFASGRRRYRCRAYVLDPNGGGLNGDRLQPKFVVVLERVSPQSPDIARWCEAFQLTGRESETVKLLLKGLTSKEIANQMRISPSTVKSFLKLVMTKVGATSRTGIIAKILGDGIVILFLQLGSLPDVLAEGLSAGLW
jgi:DNA-binding CsgD family transcriptional regulator